MKKANPLEYMLSLSEVEPDNAPPGRHWQDKRFTENGYLFWLNANPIRMYPGYSLPDELTMAEIGRCLECAALLEKGTNMLCHKVNGHYKALSMNMLAKRLGVCRRQCYRFVQKMIDTRVMVKVDRKLFMNPIYFFRGRYLSFYLYGLFKEELDRVLPKWVIERYNAGKEKTSDDDEL